MKRDEATLLDITRAAHFVLKFEAGPDIESLLPAQQLRQGLPQK